MISKNKCEATFDDLKRCRLKMPPDARGSWRGVPHAKLIDALQDRSSARGYVATQARYDLSRCGADLTAGWTTASPNRSLRYGFGVKASNAMRTMLTFYAGVVDSATGVPVVTKCFPGWRYTETSDVQSGVNDAIEEWLEEVSTALPIVGVLKTLTVDPAISSLYLMEAGRRKILSWRSVGRVDGDWRRGLTATQWGLYSSVWSAGISISPPQEQMERCFLFRQILSGGGRVKCRLN